MGELKDVRFERNTAFVERKLCVSWKIKYINVFMN